jgi:pilus assembly protein CpaE
VDASSLFPAAQIAFALRRITNQRVLLADFDLMGGTIGFYLKLSTQYSLANALEIADRLDPASWAALTATHKGLDILPAPEYPHSPHIDQAALHQVLEYMRLMYDWTVIDLPSIYHQLSLITFAEVDHGLLVTTPEVSALHLATKAVKLLQSIGLERDRYQMVVNRVDGRDSFNQTDLEKLLKCKVRGTLPNDYQALHRVVTLGQPLISDCELGKSIQEMAQQLTGVATSEQKSDGALSQARPAYS